MSQHLTVQELDAAQKRLSDYERSRPDVVTLAMLASMARKIEPELLRALRFSLSNRFLADQRPTVGTEAALWFSSFIESRGSDGITLLPEFSKLLRERLRLDSSLLEATRKVIQECHEKSPPIICWEENLIYLSLSNSVVEGERKQLIDQEVWKVVKAISTDKRPGLEEWIVEIGDRLPVAASQDPLLSQLRNLSQIRILQRDTFASDISDFTQIAKLDFSEVPTVVLDVLMVSDVFRIGFLSGEGEYGIRVPNIEPITLEILDSTVSRKVTTLVVPSGEYGEISVQSDSIRIRTIDGRIYLIDPKLFEMQEMVGDAWAATENKLEQSASSGQLIVEKINSLNIYAQKLYDEGKCSEAIKKWKEVLSLDSENKKAIEGINNTNLSSPFNVPFPRNPYFTGHKKIQIKLHDTLKSDVVATFAQAISGFGGIGKTETAVEYAYRYRCEYNAVFWVKADSREALISDYVALARDLNLPEKDAKEQGLIVVAVRRWLENNSGWLLVFDNADEPRLLEDYIPINHKGHIILTSRAQIFSNLGIMNPIKMDKMSPEESKEFLLIRTGRNKHQLEQIEIDIIEQIGEELDYFPLALEHAGAYIHEKNSSFNDYLISYRKRGIELLEKTKSDRYQKTVATTWSLNFEQVEQTSNAAIDLLYVSAFLNPYSIPLELIAQGADELGPVLSESLADVESNPLALDEVLDPLNKYSLISRDPVSRTYSIHRMVQAVLKDRMDNDTQRKWAECTIKAVDKTFPEVEFKTWNVCETMIPHAITCLELIEKSNFEFQEAARLLNKAGNYLKARALYGVAKLFLEQALGIRKKVLEEDNPDLAETFNNLAGLYRAQGKYKEAEEYYNNALATRKKLGEEHPDLAETFNDLAGLYRAQGKYKEAEEYYNNALAIRKKLGEDDPDLAETFDSLAGLYQDQGKYEKAEEFYNTALNINKKVLGEDHPDLATTLNNLGLLYKNQGKYEKAEEFYNTALNINKKVFGEDHPDLAATFNNLGLIYRDQGKYNDAEPMFWRALEIRDKSLGKDHPDVANSLNNLAELFRVQGKYNDAESLYRRSLEVRERVLGNEHPDTLASINGLAMLLRSKGDYMGAEPLYRRALESRERVLGNEHPDTLTSVNNLAMLLKSKGDYKGAESLLRRALEGYERVLGNEHPDTLTSVNNLALLLYSKGDYKGAEPLYRRALESRERVLGNEHPNTLASINGLAMLLRSKGDYMGAEPLLRRALMDYERVLGNEHPDTLANLNNLALLFYSKGDYKGAEPLVRRALEGICKVSRNMGGAHPHQEGMVNNYASCLQKMGLNEVQVRQKLEAVLNSFGFNVDDFLTP